MPSTKREIITISDDEDEAGDAVGAVKKPQTTISAPAPNTACIAKLNNNNKQGSPSTRTNVPEAARCSPTSIRCRSVVGSASGHVAPELESRFISEPSDAAAPRSREKTSQHGTTLISAPQAHPEQLVAPIACMNPRQTSAFGAASFTPVADMGPRPTAGQELPKVPGAPFSAPPPMDFGSLLATPLTYQQIACGLASDYYGLPTSAVTPVTATEFQGLMGEGQVNRSNAANAGQSFYPTSDAGLPTEPSSPEASAYSVSDKAISANGNQLKRKSKGASTPATKRAKTPAASRASPTHSSTVVNSVLWSTPPHDPSKVNKTGDNKAEDTSPSMPNKQRRPRSKPWTCKMLADLGALIQKSVPWGEFAEKNGKSLADVLETYSIVVSMPLLEFAERGEKRIAQKKFREMRQKYKEMEKDAVKTGNDEPKKSSEDGNNGRKTKEAKGKECERNTAKPPGAGKKAAGKKTSSSVTTKTQAEMATPGGTSKALGDDPGSGSRVTAPDPG